MDLPWIFTIDFTLTPLSHRGTCRCLPAVRSCGKCREPRNLRTRIPAAGGGEIRGNIRPDIMGRCGENLGKIWENHEKDGLNML